MQARTHQVCHGRDKRQSLVRGPSDLGYQASLGYRATTAASGAESEGQRTYLFDVDGRFPILLLTQDAQANGARRKNIRVEESSRKTTLGWLRREVLGELHRQREDTTIP